MVAERVVFISWNSGNFCKIENEHLHPCFLKNHVIILKESYKKDAPKALIIDLGEETWTVYKSSQLELQRGKHVS